MTPLPIRPAPISDESLPGYVLRLALVNGWRTPSNFMSALGWPSLLTIRTDDSSLIQRLHYATGHKEILDKHYFLPSNDIIFARNSGNVFSSVAVNHVQLCPLCLIVKPYHHSTWCYLPFTHCIEHQQPLLHRCTCCNEKFKWKDGLFGRGCSVCGSSWKKMSKDKQEGIPSYLSEYLTSNSQKDYIHDLMVAAQRIIRPFDELLDSTQRLPNVIVDWAPILENAYSLLTDDDYGREWLSQCAIERREVKKLGVAAINSPALTVIEKLKSYDWAISALDLNGVSDEPAANLQSLTLSTLPSRLPDKNSDRDMQFQTNIVGLDRIIGCEKNTSVTLARNGVFTGLNKNTRPNSSLYDLRELKLFVDSLQEETQESNLSKLTSFEWLFPFFNTEMQDVLLGIFKRNINIKISGDISKTILERFVVSEFVILRFLIKNLIHQSNQNHKISMKTLCSMLVINMDELMLLINHEIIKPVKTNRPAGRYEVADCIHFLKNYWSLNRWVKIYQVPPAEVLTFLNSRGIYGSISQNIFRYTHKLKSTLRLLKIKVPD